MPEKHVIVVDDSDDDFNLLQIGFRKAGLAHHLIHISTGEKAISYLAGQLPPHERNIFPSADLVLLDIMMPRVNGFEVLKFIRAHPEIKVPVVVMLSGSIIPQDAEKAAQLGAAAFFSKPSDLPNLVKLARTLDERWLTP